jgi:hypothetical protein
MPAPALNGVCTNAPGLPTMRSTHECQWLRARTSPWPGMLFQSTALPPRHTWIAPSGSTSSTPSSQTTSVPVPGHAPAGRPSDARDGAWLLSQ